MKRILKILHHRSLTISLVACFFGVNAFAFIPEHGYRLHQQGTRFLFNAGIAATVALVADIITLIVLLRDDRSGYPSMRFSLATLLWALGCFPTGWLAVIVLGGVLKS